MKLLPVLLAVMLTACRSEAPPAPTSEQADQLDDAEAMLNDLAANEEGPANRSTGPSNSSN